MHRNSTKSVILTFQVIDVMLRSFRVVMILGLGLLMLSGNGLRYVVAASDGTKFVPSDAAADTRESQTDVVLER